MPSLAQLNDAVMAFIEEHPDALITVVVDATFGHRIDGSEVKEFDAAVTNNEVVAPPAGAIGRGDAFLLSIANKVGATVLSNDSFQEFHGTYTWLFDEGRLIGGKPVPHIGWVFVARVPVRGPISRTAVKDAKRNKSGSPLAASAPPSTRTSKRLGGPESTRPMPVPKAPPPNATLRGASPATPPTPAAAAPSGRQPAESGAGGQSSTKANAVNDLIPFLSFVEVHPVGTVLTAQVESYSSHGAYVRLDGDVVGYVPLRMMANPAPRSAREFMTIGDTVTLVVESFAATRRSIDLATVATATASPPPAKAAKAPRKASGRAAKAAAGVATDEAIVVADAPVVADAETATPAKRGGRKRGAAAALAPSTAVEAAAALAAEFAADVPVADAPAIAESATKPAPRKRAAKAAKLADSVAPPPAEPAPAQVAPARAAPAKARGAKKAAPVADTPAPAPTARAAKPAKAPSKSAGKRAAAAPAAPLAADPAPVVAAVPAPARAKRAPKKAAAAQVVDADVVSSAARRRRSPR